MKWFSKTSFPPYMVQFFLLIVWVGKTISHFMSNIGILIKLNIYLNTMLESNYSSCIGRSNENICSSRVPRKKERQDEIQFTPKLVEN